MKSRANESYRRFLNLLYRRFPNRQSHDHELAAGLETCDTADFEVCGTALAGRPRIFALKAQVGTARCAVRAAFSGATSVVGRRNGSRRRIPPAVRAVTAQRAVPTRE